eukprot:12216659-Karenia_brevis.AAC.1
MAGQRSYGVQAALTLARERHAMQRWDVLPQGDARQRAWLNVNSYSAAWVSAWPSAEQCVPDAQFGKITS